MKFFAILSAFHLFFLASFPCCIGIDCHANEIHAEWDGERVPDSDNHEEAPCCPMYNCSLCMGFTEFSYLLQFEIQETVLSAGITIFFDGLSPNLRQSKIFQPPRTILQIS